MTPPHVVLTVSRRVAGGQLTWAAWQALTAAEAVVVTEGATAQLPALRTAGVRVAAQPPEDGGVVWVADSEEAPALQERLVAGGHEVRVVAGARELPGSHVLDLVALMDRLRSPGGCPWDAEQTHESLSQYLLEETYEVLEAIELRDRDALQEELGDLLLQVAFHARLATEEPEPFGIDEVAAGIVAKLVRRHPHVFAGAGAEPHSEQGWDAIKRAEKGRTSAVDGVPMAQPALALAMKLVGRVERAGLFVPTSDGADVAPEVAAGDALLEVVAELRRQGIDAEAALRAAVRRFSERVRLVEAERVRVARAEGTGAHA